MAIMGIKIFLTLLLLSSVFSLASSRREPSSSSSNIDWWCNLTPHPEPCKYYISETNPHHKIKHKSEFRGMLVQLALKQALIMQSEAHDDFEENLVTKKHRAVHNDCLKLYENTIFHLNRTLEGMHRFSPIDAHTWLSTALTNIQTCRTGAEELSVEDFMMQPNVSSNITEMMIRNSLAINVDFLKQNEDNYHTAETKDALFPGWFSRHERKLLKSSSIKAHLVVAKDGSGHFRTVQDALNAAARRKVKTRFVIHVKKGVYVENIEVEKNNDNIMLVGDGMRNTIITSSRCVQDGFTTFSSATAGM